MKRLFLLFLLFVAPSAFAVSVTRIARADGNWTAAGTWGIVSQATDAELDSEAGSTFTTTSPVYSATFIPGAVEIDGVAVKVASVKSNTPTGTVTIVLQDSAAGTNVASVALNVADIPGTDMTAAAVYTPSSWVYVHGWLLVTFSPITLVAGRTYNVGVSSSTANQVAFYRNATAGNWSRMIRTTATGAPATTDKLIICGERTGAGAVTARTVTMDNTDTTTFGQIATATFCQSVVVCDQGTLAFDTTASTFNILTVAGQMLVGEGGTLTMGTAGTPTPSTSTNRLRFDLTATGDSALTIGNGGTFETAGATKEPWAYLYTGVESGTTSTNYTLVSRSGGTLNWGNNDLLVFGPSGITYSEYDLRTNSTFVNGTNGTLQFGAGFTYDHPSTNTDLRCPVGNLTRNVQVMGESTTLLPVFFMSEASTNNLQFASFTWIGPGGTTGKEAAITSDVGVGEITVNGCAAYNNVAYGIYQDASQSAAAAPVFTSNTVFASASSAMGLYFGQNTRPGNPPYRAGTRISDNLVIGTGTVNLGTFRIEAYTNAGSFIVTNNTVCGTSGMGYKINGPFESLVFHNNTAHSCGQVGIWLNCFTSSNTVIRGLRAARNKGGVHFTAGNWTLTDSYTFGNANAGLSVNGGQSIVFTNCYSFGEVSYPQTNGVIGGFPSLSMLSGNMVGDVTTGVIGGQGGGLAPVTMIDCTLGSSSQTMATTNTYDIGNYQPRGEYQIVAYNTLMASSGEVALPAANTVSWVGSEKHDTTAGSNKFWSIGGSGFGDTVVFHTASPSQRIIPSSASTKFVLPSRYCFRVPVTSSATRTITVYVWKSAAYNGNQPRIIALPEYTIGIPTNAVIATMTAGTESWEQLSGTTPAVTADGTLLVYVDCDGTAGYINVDDWTFSVLDSRGVTYWTDGFPNVQADNATGGGGETSHTFAQ